MMSDARSEDWHGPRVLAILSILMAFASISTDLYRPALPAMEQGLHVGPGTIELTIPWYLIGFSVAQLFWVAIADRYGWKRSVTAALHLGSEGRQLDQARFREASKTRGLRIT
jgi:DHA1 family bicyclomycin/chloramphenicol resistance-like MFS transporter